LLEVARLGLCQVGVDGGVQGIEILAEPKGMELLAVILQDGLVVIGLAAFYQLIAVGIVLIIAVSAGGALFLFGL